jgi:hypothetical protein
MKDGKKRQRECRQRVVTDVSLVRYTKDLHGEGAEAYMHRALY